jgi:hypothetical protein
LQEMAQEKLPYAKQKSSCIRDISVFLNKTLSYVS